MREHQKEIHRPRTLRLAAWMAIVVVAILCIVAVRPRTASGQEKGATANSPLKNPPFSN